MGLGRDTQLTSCSWDTTRRSFFEFYRSVLSPHGVMLKSGDWHSSRTLRTTLSVVVDANGWSGPGGDAKVKVDGEEPARADRH